MRALGFVSWASRLAWVAWVAGVASVLCAMAGVCLADTRLRVVVRTEGARGEALWARISGQTVDLDVELVHRPGVLETGFAAQLGAARDVSLAESARVVVWAVEMAGGGLLVYVAEPVAETVFVRRIAPEPDHGTASGREAARESATIEAAAVAVRSALRALAVGSRIGVTPAEAERVTAEAERDATQARQEPTAASASDTASVSDAASDTNAASASDTASVSDAASDADAESPALPARSTRLGWHLAAGALVAFDGASRFGHAGVRARGGIHGRRLLADISVSTHPASSLADALTEVSLGRHTAALAIGYAVPLGAGTAPPALTAEVESGALLYQRSTRALSPEVTPAPSATLWSWFVAPGARLSLPLGRRGLRIELAASLQVVTLVPELGYEIAGEFVVRNRLWWLQPRLELGFALGSPPG